MLFTRGEASSLNCPKFTKICPFLLTIFACPGNYADIWPIISQIFRYQPPGFFVFHPLFPFRLVTKWLLHLERKRRDTIICTFTSWYYIVDQKIVQNSQAVRKTFNLRPLWFINQGQKFSRTCCFCKMMVQYNIEKAISGKI